MSFRNLPKEELKRISQKGGLVKRNPQLQKAWDASDEIKSDYIKGVSTQQIANKYNVQRRMIYRILNS